MTKSRDRFLTDCLKAGQQFVILNGVKNLVPG
jgi:hypothetical protein